MDCTRLLPKEVKDDRNVMGGKAPQDVLLRPKPSEIQTVRMDVLNPSQCSTIHQLLELDNRGMVSEEMADHEHPAASLREFGENAPVSHLQGQWFLDEDVFPGV
jgi:hypothetical protein